MKHSDQQKQKIISLYPFPIGYVYQKLAVHDEYQKTTRSNEKEDIREILWFVLQNVNILLKLVGTISVSDYLVNRYRFTEPDLNAEIFNVMNDCGTQNWYRMISSLSSRVPAEERTMSELSALNTPLISLSSNDFEKINLFQQEREYSWLELMAELIKLQDELQTGKYRLSLPDRSVLDCYSYLLEEAYLHCDFLQKYGIYVLISKDERKTRGFLCCGTKSKPIGIRGISNEKWHIYKGRPFMSYKQNQNVSLFPYIVPWVQKIGTKTGFSDLLLLENISHNTLFYYSYRYNRIVSHEECTTNALFFVQKDLRWLEDHLPEIERKKNDITDFRHLAKGKEWELTRIRFFYEKILLHINNSQGNNLYVSLPSGSGKSTTALALYHFDKTEKLNSIVKNMKYYNLPIFVYYFCTVSENYITRAEFIRSIYAQVLQHVFHYPVAKIEQRIYKLPCCFDTLLQNFGELLWKAEREVLQPQNKTILIIVDGLKICPEYAQLNLPPHVYTLYFIEKTTKHISSWVSFADTFDHSSKELISHQITGEKFIDIDKKYMLASKSKENFLFSKLYIEAFRKKYFSELDEIPSNIDELMDIVWSRIPDNYDFIAHKILAIAAISHQYIHDALIVELFHVSRDAVFEMRYAINIFLLYDGYKYTISHPYYRNYIVSLLSKYDRKIYFGKLAQYYDCFTSTGQRDVQGIKKDGLWDLTHYYTESQQLEKAISIISDKSLQQEKIKYFKTHKVILNDINVAMKESYEKSLWEHIFELSFEYCDVEMESQKGVYQAFRYAENGDYGSALERAKTIKNEVVFFQMLMFLLICTIDNQEPEQSDIIFEELEKLPDYQVNYVAEGLEPLVLSVLHKIAKSGLLPIHTIIGKHGLQGTDAVSHLLDLQTQIDFTPDQLKIFLGHLIHTSIELGSEHEKYEIITELVNNLDELGSFNQNRDIWVLLARFIDSFENILLKIECTITIAKKLSSVNNINFLHSFIENFTEQLESLPIEETIALRSKYSVLINFIGDEEQAKYHLEKVLLSVQPLGLELQYQAYREILATIKRIGSFSSMRIYWKRLLSLAKEEVNNEIRELFLSELCIYFADLERWEYVFDLFKQISSVKSELRANTLIQISEKLKSIPGNVLTFWEIILEQVKYLPGHKQRVVVLENTADGLFFMGVLPSDMIWKTYLSLCSILKDIGHDEDKNKVLSYLACKMADAGHTRNSHKIISRLSSPLYRSKPLSRIVIYDLSQNTWDSLRVAADISEIADLFQVFLSAAEIWNKKQNKVLESRLFELLENAIKNQEYHYYILVKIYDLLLIPRQIEENKNIWVKLLVWINYLEDKDKKRIFKKYLDKLSLVAFFENAKFLWTDIYNIIQKVAQGHEKSILYAQIANIFIFWDQVQEASKNLLFAEQNAISENLDQSLDALANIANIYRKIGNEKKSSELMKKIVENTEYSQLSLSEKYSFVVRLYEMKLEDFARDSIKNIIAPFLDTEEKGTSIEVLFSIISLALDAQQNVAARNLFFQTLPVLYKESKNYETIPDYNMLVEIFNKMKHDDEVFEMWKYAQGITLNFAEQNLQEKYTEALANSLIELGEFETTKTLWQKLIYDCRYIGKDFDAAKLIANVGKIMLKVAQWKDFEENFEYIVKVIDSLSSEYEKLTILDSIANTVITIENFQVKSEPWQQLENIPRSWSKEECQNIAYMNLCKTLSSHANSGVKRVLFAEAEHLAQRITKTQQVCEILIFIGQNYLDNDMHNETLKVLEKALEGRTLGKFYSNHILPKILDLLICNKNFELAEVLINDVDFTKKIYLLLNLAYAYRNNNKKELADGVYQKIRTVVSETKFSSSDEAKANIAICRYAVQYQPQEYEMWIEKFFFCFKKIESDLLKKETIDFVASTFENLNLVDEIWEKIIEITFLISHDKYRSWSLEAITRTLLVYNTAMVKKKILTAKNIDNEALATITKRYIHQILKSNKWQESLFSLSLITSKERKNEVIHYLATEVFAMKEEEKLFMLLVKFPGNFKLTSFIISKILCLALIKKKEEQFIKWLKITLSHIIH